MAAEQKLEAAIVNYARDRGILTYKFVSPANRGVPDRILLFPGGIVLFLELKAPNGRISPIQRRTLLKMGKQGTLVAVISEFSKAVNLIDAILTQKSVIADK